MSASTQRLAMVSALLVLGAAGCTFDEGSNDARGCDEQCAPGMCVLGYCLQALGDAQNGIAGGAGAGGTAGSGGTGAPTGTAGGSAGSGGSTPPTPCVADAACYAGPAETRGLGTCRDGVSRCAGGLLEACVGQVLPAINESCNEQDDDCDGLVDEAMDLGSCSAPGTGMCTTGVLSCDQGVETCRVTAEPSTEACNGVDDDCDGITDEDSSVACYPDGAAGCVANADGSYDCTGLCTPGTRACSNGQLAACAGFVKPVTEVCGGDEAGDENCNGTVDDGCPCSGDETQRCYSGPAFTAGVGICRAGTQHCEGGLFGACQGAVTPGTESCANLGADDDCDRVRDDIGLLGVLCFDLAAQGLCRYGTLQCSGSALACDTPSPTTEATCDGYDQDCDGRTDETFDLASDEANCGACGTRCRSGELCCGGACRNIAADPQHCGRCQRACGDSAACCSGACVDTTTPQHCGGCGACGPGQACCGGGCVPTNTIDHCGGCGACGPGQACCGGGCVDTNTTAHCGGCGACGPGQACCGGGCVDTDTTAHCGGCGGCAGGQACCNGGCVPTGTNEHCAGCDACGLDQTCCSNACVTTGSDHGNCGGCAIDCGACSCVGGECQDGQGAVCL